MGFPLCQTSFTDWVSITNKNLSVGEVIYMWNFFSVRPPSHTEEVHRFKKNLLNIINALMVCGNCVCFESGKLWEWLQAESHQRLKKWNIGSHCFSLKHTMFREWSTNGLKCKIWTNDNHVYYSFIKCLWKKNFVYRGREVKETPFPFMDKTGNYVIMNFDPLSLNHNQIILTGISNLFIIFTHIYVITRL